MGFCGFEWGLSTKFFRAVMLGYSRDNLSFFRSYIYLNFEQLVSTFYRLCLDYLGNNHFNLAEFANIDYTLGGAFLFAGWFLFSGIRNFFFLFHPRKNRFGYFDIRPGIKSIECTGIFIIHILLR